MTEYWDVYDGDRNPTGRTHRRGDPMADGDFHIVVHVWMKNNCGEYLLTRRDFSKGFPGMWESTGGSALAGDDSLSAAIREVKEETGLDLDPSCGKMRYVLQSGGMLCGRVAVFAGLRPFECGAPSGRDYRQNVRYGGGDT